MTGQCKGFAFVNYYRKEDAAKAIATLNGYGYIQTFYKRKCILLLDFFSSYDYLILSVEWAKPALDR